MFVISKEHFFGVVLTKQSTLGIDVDKFDY